MKKEEKRIEKFKIYLAGANEVYYGTENKYYEEWRNEVKRWMCKWANGVRVISPPDYYQYDITLHKSNTEVFRFYLQKVRKSDLVLVSLNDIRKSVGTCMEIYEAYRNGIPVIGYLDESIDGRAELENKIHPWVYECCTRIETGDSSLNNALLHIKDFYID